MAVPSVRIFIDEIRVMDSDLNLRRGSQIVLVPLTSKTPAHLRKYISMHTIIQLDGEAKKTTYLSTEG